MSVSTIVANITVLQGESNFSSWQTSLHSSLDALSKDYFRVLTGEITAPPVPVGVSTHVQKQKIQEWEGYKRYSTFLLSVIRATIAPELQPMMEYVDSATTAYQIIKNAFGAKTHLTSYSRLAEFIDLKYTGINQNPKVFIDEWLKALSDFQNTCGHDVFSKAAIFLLLLKAISNPITQSWINGLRLPMDFDNMLESMIAIFLVTEERRLVGLASFSPTKYQVAICRYCKFRNQPWNHTEDQCTFKQAHEVNPEQSATPEKHTTLYIHRDKKKTPLTAAASADPANPAPTNPPTSRTPSAFHVLPKRRFEWDKKESPSADPADPALASPPTSQPFNEMLRKIELQRQKRRDQKRCLSANSADPASVPSPPKRNFKDSSVEDYNNAC